MFLFGQLCLRKHAMITAVRSGEGRTFDNELTLVNAVLDNVILEGWSLGEECFWEAKS